MPTLAGLPERPCCGLTLHKRGFDRIVAAQPILVRISAAKRLRDASEQAAKAAGVSTVEIGHVQHASESLQFGDAA